MLLTDKSDVVGCSVQKARCKVGNTRLTGRHNPNRRGKRVKGGRMGEGAPWGGGGRGREGRRRSEGGGRKRERRREGHRWVMLVGGFKDVLVDVYRTGGKPISRT